ncbi:MAG: hypothetical protein GY855_03700 [candidate division Zixibacteria bacterium]|nr:hypothetical protein [candidate division Zixibacteria bacterium]
MKPARTIISLLFISIVLINCADQPEGDKKMNEEPDKEQISIVFAAYAESEEQLIHTYYLAESIREFGGRYNKSPIWVYIPEGYDKLDADMEVKFTALGAEIKTSVTPKEALWLYFAGKVFAAGKAEKEAVKKAQILVWMDEDTIVLQEPLEFELDDNIGFAYRPVMHNRSGSLYSEKPGPFWSRIYELLEVEENSLFPMVTPADRQTIKVYFNAGLLVVRPSYGILKNWGESFETLYNDSTLVEMCKEDIEKRIFIHQTALVSTVNILKQKEMVELPASYNYPIFFHQQYEAVGDFCSIEDVVTLRYDVYFRNPDPEWGSKLKGSEKVVSWLKERLGKD